MQNLRNINKVPKINFGSFELISQQSFEENKVQLSVLRHSKLGSYYYHFGSDDINNSFAIVLKTLPENDKGLPHILEHTALCGSKRYPVRDPFFNMLSRSLNTYMNAWTGPDFTMYPFSTQNPQDFENLLRVYLDAALNPRLDQKDFLQEGWRFSIDEDKLIYKGIVLNEMKGVYQSSEDFFSRQLFNVLLESTEYWFDSGGVPKYITQLSFEEFREFHKKFYHPTNCCFISYGNLGFENHLKILEKEFLVHFEEKKEFLYKENQQKKLENWPKKVFLKGPEDSSIIDKNRAAFQALVFLLPQNLSLEEQFALQVFSQYIFNTPKSVFNERVLQKDIAKGYSVIGLEKSIQYPFFSFGFMGVSIQQIDQENLFKMIREILKEISEKEIDQKMLQGIFHQILLDDKIGKTNKGIEIFGKFHKQFINKNLDDFVLYFNLQSTLKNVENILTNQEQFQSLLTRCFLENEKHMQLIMHPDKDFLNEQKQKEKEELEKIQAQMTQNEIESLSKQDKELEEYQNQKQDVEKLPILSKEDISLKNVTTEIKQEIVDQIPVSFIKDMAPGLTSLRMRIEITGFPQSLVGFINIYAQFLSQLGTKLNDYKEFSQIIQQSQSEYNVHVKSVKSKEGKLKQFIFIEFFALDQNLQQAFKNLNEFLIQINFDDKERIKQLLNLESQSVTNSLSNNMSYFASSALKKTLLDSEKIYNAFDNALFFINFYKNYKNNEESSLYIDELIFQLKYIHSQIFKKNSLEFLVHTQENNNPIISKSIQELAYNLQENFKGFLNTQNNEQKIELNKAPQSQAFLVDSLTNYNYLGFKVSQIWEENYASLTIGWKLLESKYLHKYIREQGGAYGASAGIDSEGILFLSSYWDPNLEKTYQSFFKGIQSFLNEEISDEELTGALLRHFSSMDNVKRKDQIGTLKFYSLIEESDFQRYRDQCLGVTKEKIKNAFKEIIQSKIDQKEFAQVAFCSQNHTENYFINNWEKKDLASLVKIEK